jgi:hypothetical protein
MLVTSAVGGIPDLDQSNRRLEIIQVPVGESAGSTVMPDSGGQPSGSECTAGVDIDTGADIDATQTAHL